MIKPAGILIAVALVPIQVFGVLYLIRLCREHIRFFRNALVVDGIVVGTRMFSAGDGMDYFARVYYSVQGTEYALKNGIWTQWRRYKKGQTVKLYYSPGSPEKARVAEPLVPYILILGAILISATVIILLWALLSELALRR